MQKIIFLDIDGVMNTRSNILYLLKNNLPYKDMYGTIFDPKCCVNLAHIIEETGANIVVSSMWKYDMSLDEIQKMWKDRDLPGKVIDTTPNCSQYSRLEEINQWLQSCNYNCQYVIFDDLPESQFSPQQKLHFIQTNGNYGITEEVAKKAIEILNQ